MEEAGCVKIRIAVRGGNLCGFRLTIEQIKSEMVSKRRNEIIAELFHRIHFVEKWGRGISLILSKEPTADFKEVADIFITTFKRKNYEPKKEKFPEGQEKKEPGRGLVDGLVENQKKIVRLIHRDPHISKKKMAEIIGISTTAVDKNIETLKKQGILKRVGSDKGGHWEIKI